MSDPFSGHALLVEDNLIIALDVTDILENAGASKVHLAANCDEALSVLEQNPVAYAVIDMLLENQTSQPVALALKARGIPFIYASGIQLSAEQAIGFPEATCVDKPFSPDMLLSALKGSIIAM